MFLTEKKKTIFYVVLLSIFSILINQHYGYQGINPIDSFFSFNSGYDVLIGKFPFKDYWTITGPFIDLIQAFFFKLFGVSWFSYVLHASFFNFIITISTFYIFYKFKLNSHYCFLYALLVSILAYPSAGTPYVDHQSSYLSIIGIYCFILALNTNLRIYWLLLPIIFGIAFLTKQAPTSHILLISIFLSAIYFVFNFDLNKIIFGIIGSLIFLLVFFTVFYIGKISLNSFFHQYILFPLSLGGERLEFLFPLEFKRIILRFKLLHLSLLIPIIVSIREIIKNYKYLKDKEFLITLSLIGSSFALIAHQLMTINGIFIFFIIPIFFGFSHIYCLRHFKKNSRYISILLILLSVISTIYYGNKYIISRHFMDLDKANMKKAIPAEVFDEKLKGLKWITFWNLDNPQKEISKLKEAIDIIKKDSRKKTIVTDYQFISVILSFYDNSPSKVWYAGHVNPVKNSKYFDIYKQFFIDKLKENEVEIVYTIKPLWGEYDALEAILNKNCIKKVKITEILESQLLLSCQELKK